MKLVVYGPQRRLGIVINDVVVDASMGYAKLLHETTHEPQPYAMAAAVVPDELGAFIEGGERSIEAANRTIEYVQSSLDVLTGPGGEPISQPLTRVKLHAPYARRARIMMAGGNYAIHSLGMSHRGGDGPAPTLNEVYEQARARGIWGFYCFPENAAGPDEDIVYPSRTDRLDYEGEVAVILGKRGKDIAAANAAPYFWGYMLQNDVSARTNTGGGDNPLSSFARAKNFDTSICGGPYVVVGEFADAQNIEWETRVNGLVRQQGNTKDMTFSFAEYLEYMSSDMTLLPGDVISAGTTAGTAQDSSELIPGPGGGQIRAPDLFLKPGDVVEVSNAQMGTLRNRVVEKPKG
ncbi:MAG TPA: fumarylacetoacetate hydrolase family protein [Gammaproteobacteria bacterium]|nr:fumarylacetoacetate hydrolase family protein [Gammaproteobacteria bacterium]